MNVADLLRAAADAHPDGSALVGPGRPPVTFREWDAEADRVARALPGLGVGPGDRVALGMHNVPEFAFAYFGVLRAGAVAVPLNVMLTEPEVERILDDAGARMVLTAPPFDAVVDRAAASLGCADRVISTDRWERLGPLDGPPVTGNAGDGDLAVLAYTSGTTGEPRGAMLSHGNLIANLRQQMAVPEDEVTRDDVLLLALPLFHIFGLNVTLGLVVLNGATGVLVERFDPVETLRLIERHKVTVLFGAPPMYVGWLRAAADDTYDLSSVRIAVSGAAPLAIDVLHAFKKRFGIDVFEGYGMTETAPTITSGRVSERPRPGSVGKPLPEIELRLVDEDGRDVELGDPGEIVVRGPNVFSGYWQRPEETEQSLRDGWFSTGDVAVRDEDGYLYLVDRKRDLILVSGFNVFPSEVENALLRHPAVAEAAVIGVPHPYSGEAVRAYVVLETGATLTERELLADVSTRLARFKCPDRIEIVDELPHLLTGKVLRRALRT
ncbi:MAG: long-chain fatty acid--CoA ligase [Actinomycetota bacterium]